MNQKIYKDDRITFSTEDVMRGSGVVEIHLISNMLEILNYDNSIYERFIFHDDFYSIDNDTDNIVARKVIFNSDFFSLIFDSHLFEEDDEYVLIYINQSLKKIKKEKYSITYSDWIDYVRDEYIKLKEDNLLQVKTDYGSKFLESSIDYVYSVKEMINNELVLISTSTGCCKCTEKIEGIVKWKDDNNRLLVDICVID